MTRRPALDQRGPVPCRGGNDAVIIWVITRIMAVTAYGH